MIPRYTNHYEPGDPAARSVDAVGGWPGAVEHRLHPPGPCRRRGDARQEHQGVPIPSLAVLVHCRPRLPMPQAHQQREARLGLSLATTARYRGVLLQQLKVQNDVRTPMPPYHADIYLCDPRRGHRRAHAHWPRWAIRRGRGG